MRLEREKVDAVLANFLLSLAGTQPVSRTLLQVDGRFLGLLAASPSSSLIRAWQELTRQELRRSVKALGGKKLSITPALIGIAVILNNRVAAIDELDSDVRSQAARYNRNLLDFLPSPRTESEILGFDLLISAYSDFLRTDAALDLDQVEIDLLNLSPFTALKSLDLLLPNPLFQLAPEYLSHWSAEKDFSGSEQWWSAVAEIIDQPNLVCSLREVWLHLPENRSSCLGLGIFLEEIRRRGQNDDFILSFFEAYEFLQKIRRTDSADEARVDLIDLIKSQLSASGESLSGRRLNQIGNEYFLKFRALLEIIAARGGIPSEFRHLSHDFCFKRLLPLVSMATITGGQRLAKQSLTTFSEVKFS